MKYVKHNYNRKEDKRRSRNKIR